MNEVIWISNRCFVRMYLCVCECFFLYNVFVRFEFVIVYSSCVRFRYEREIYSVYYIFMHWLHVCVCVFVVVSKSYPISKSISKYNRMRMVLNICTSSHTRTHVHTAIQFNHSVEMCVFYPVNFHICQIHNNLFFVFHNSYYPCSLNYIHLFNIPPQYIHPNFF